MATNPIYVETEEEIPEVVERLRQVRGEDTMLVLPLRSRVGQSRFNFQLLRNYAARLGKRVTVVCDDPAVQRMAAETGFPVFGTVGVDGEGIPSAPVAEPPPKPWWSRSRRAQEGQTHVGVAAPTKLITKNATELKPGRFLLYVAAATILALGVFAFAVYVPSASVTLVAQAQPFAEKDVEIQAQPDKGTIRVRANVISSSNSQGFKTTGLIQVQLAPSTGAVMYTNAIPKPKCPQAGCKSPGLVLPYGQRLLNSNGITFAQTSGDTVVVWNNGTTDGTAQVSVQAVNPGAAGNVGSATITTIVGNPYSGLTATNPQATGGGADASSKPVETVADFDAARAQLEQELRQSIAQQLTAAIQPNEKLSETIIYSAPQFTTDHQPNDNVASFSGTMTMQGEGDFYFDGDVKKAFETYLGARIPNNQQLLPESPVQTDYRILSATKGGNLTFVGSATAFVAPLLDQNKIRAAIVGRPLASARFYLQGLPIRSVTIKEQPITLPLMPLLLNRITLHYVVQQGAIPGQVQPTTSPAPTASPKPSP